MRTPTTSQPRTEFLSSTGMERTAFVLFCAIAVMALMLTTVLGTDPAPQNEQDASPRQGLFVIRPAENEQSNAVGGFKVDSSDE